MNDIKSLRARVEAALERIEHAGVSAASAQGPDTASDERIAELEAENARLSQALAELQDERSKDLAQLDVLIEQLRPLVEEAG